MNLETTMTENEDADPVGGARDPRKTFTELAIASGATGMTEELWQYTMVVVGMCAAIGDAYGDGEAGGNAGEAIRAEFYD